MQGNALLQGPYLYLDKGYNISVLHIVKDVVVVKLFPSIHLSCHPSSLAKGIIWLPILLLL
jgi:hypothetical protein